MPEAATAQTLHPTRVIDVVSPTATTRLVRLARPAGFAFDATHAVRLFLTHPEHPSSREMSRSMSIASGPARPYLDFAARESDSDFKRAFFALRPGDRSWLRGPKGRFLLDRSRPALMFGGGIGVTPFRCMLQSIVDAGSAQQVLLVYANHDPSDVPFQEELDALADRAEKVEVLHTVSTLADGRPWPHRVGRVDPTLVGEAAEHLPGAAWYVSGPPGFVRSIIGWAMELGVPDESLHAEVFKGYPEENLSAD